MLCTVNDVELIYVENKMKFMLRNSRKFTKTKFQEGSEVKDSRWEMS